MNIQTIITFIIVGICGVLCVIMLTYGFIKNYKIRRERFKRFGYKTLTNRQKLNVLKSKVKEQVRHGYLPTVFEELYCFLTIDSKVEQAKFLNKLARKYHRKRNYYRKRVQENMCAYNYVKNLYLSKYGDKK